MRSKSSLFVSFVALLAAIGGARPSNRIQGEILLGSERVAEGLRLPALLRREKPFQNLTSRPETTQTIPESTILSIVASSTVDTSWTTSTQKSSNAPSEGPTRYPRSSHAHEPVSSTPGGEGDYELSPSTPNDISLISPYSSTRGQQLANIPPASILLQTGPSSELATYYSMSQAQVAEPTGTVGGTVITTADIQHPAQTPSLESQPIKSTIEQPTFVVISGYARVLASQLNTVAENATSSCDVPLTSGPAAITNSISTLLTTDVPTSVQTFSAMLSGSLSNDIVPCPESPITGYQVSFSHSLTPTIRPTAESIVTPAEPSATSSSSTIVKNIWEFLLASPSLSTLNFTTNITSNMTPATIRPTGLLSSAQSIAYDTLSAYPTTISVSNSPWLISSRPLPETTTVVSNWTNVPSHSPTKSNETSRRLAQPTGIFSSVGMTSLEDFHITATTVLRSSTLESFLIKNSTFVTVTSSSSIAPLTNFPTSTMLENAGYGTIKTLFSTPTLTSTASETVAASPPPPLTQSQTAGVAVGSTAGVLLAVVAAIFIARRYYAKRAARRWSAESVYPKVAYLYDPPGGANGGVTNDSTSGLMSGGSGGMPSPHSMLGAPHNSVHIGQRASTGLYNRYSDPGNPFRDAEEPPPNSKNLLSVPSPTRIAEATIAGFPAASQQSPGTSEHASREYDLPLLVNTRTETPDSVIIYAPPLTPKTPMQQSLSTKLPVLTTSENSLPSPSVSDVTFISDKTASESERFSLAYDYQSSTTYIRPASHGRSLTRPAPSDSPVSPPSAPVHKGWDEIKRYSDESSMPSPLFSTPSSISPPPYDSPPPPHKKRSVIQLRRKEPALAGTGHVMMSSTGHPLTVQIPFKYNKGFGFQGPRTSLLAKLNNMGDARRHGFHSPGLTVTESVYSDVREMPD
ncbi:Nn.00g044310.m01.CDS01 [Neocucurbitaria sp. VM-36]